ncbi:hypothetical protein BDW68DRAFT_66877 [Aspergillus falconensis]
MMGPQSLFLSEDVWHIIIDILYESPLNQADRDDETDSQGPPKLAKIYPNLHDLIDLSSTCKWMRDSIAPRILGTVHLYNTTKSALSLQAIARGKHSHCVRKIHYVATCETDQVKPALEEVYPSAVNSVLSRLSQFPNLRHLTAYFPVHRHDFFWGDLFYDPFDPSLDQALAEEEANAWRGLMASSFAAVASNELVSFEIHHLHVAEVSTFMTPAFRSFLSKLKSFKLSLQPLDNGAGWRFNTTEIFPGFADRLGPWFTHNLLSVEEFSFDPSNSSVLGEAGQLYSHNMSLQGATMPRLRKLTLSNIIICAELRDFVLRHLDVLEEIILQECYAYRAKEDWCFRWCSLFTALARAKPARLRTFKLRYDESETEKLKAQFEDVWAGEDLIAQARTKLELEPHARAFFYAYVDDKYGFRFGDAAPTLEAYLQGDDERAYSELLGVIVGNNAARRI